MIERGELVKLEELIDKELPLNRKERFFTGTVFPMIVCKDGFKYFNNFTSLIKGCGEPVISANPENTNIQFFTEYSLVESVFTEQDKKRFDSLPETKDTPDIMILVTGEPKTLISIEAKMYDMPDGFDLKDQMDSQKKHVESLKEILSIPNACQVALLPQELAEQVRQSDAFNGSKYQIITWEDIATEFGKLEAYRGDYFLSLLNLALERYGNLRCHSWGVSKACELRLSGHDIYKNWASREFTMKAMGRKEGLNGAITKDIKTNRWRNQKYETTSDESLPNQNKNWFLIEQFVRLVKEHLEYQPS